MEKRSQNQNLHEKQSGKVLCTKKIDNPNDQFVPVNEGQWWHVPTGNNDDVALSKCGIVLMWQ